MATYFTSDTHFNHLRILEYQSTTRPFKTTQEMDEILIENWNRVVSPCDTVYHLGDFMMGVRDAAPIYRRRLNGKIILIMGNHDVSRGSALKGWTLHHSLANAGFNGIHHDVCYVTIDGIKLSLSHIPNMDFIPSSVVDFHICGHVHSSWTRVGPIINCGVDVCGLRPVSLDKLLAQPEVRGNSHRGY